MINSVQALRYNQKQFLQLIITVYGDTEENTEFFLCNFS